MSLVHVEVTDQDISDGLRGSCSSCPVALAILRCAGAGHASAGKTTGSWSMPDSSRTYTGTLPVAAQEFIMRFDRQLPVGPFSFDLEPWL